MADKFIYVLDGTTPKRLKDMGDGTWAEVVAFEDDGQITLTGDVALDTFGALDDAKVVDPDADSATIPALLRGVLQQQVTMNTAIGTSADNAGDPTVIGLLKQIMTNTTII